MRKPIIAGNWKMNHGPSDTEKFFTDLNKGFKNQNNAEVVLAPPFISLYAANRLTKDSPVSLAAQNAYFKDNGAFTGETSCNMLKETGVEYVILGHSERRHVLGETNELINLKVKKVIDEGLKPILCVGEKLEERESGVTESVVKLQVEKGLDGINAEMAKNLVIAYEPVWAIGTGKSASPVDAETVCGFIRGIIAEIYSQEMADSIRILYGGSVKPANIKEYMDCTHVDGALVGGASLKPDSFLEILNY